ncbi:hypothetical protein [Nocardioides sp. LHG3406-4]|uniref:hypothetical protein n=1 Tax=Nocardioides sp. LHG3406-4 TaxID=2804575 RepID=UPI003CEA5902
MAEKDVDRLTKAAELIRERATKVPASPWGSVKGVIGRIGMATVVYGAKPDGSDTHPPVAFDIGLDMGPAAAYVVGCHPDFTLAVADLLVETARVMGLSGGQAHTPADHAALAIADTYLGGEDRG